MEKEIMTFDELVKLGEQHGIKAHYMRTRVQENAVAISMNILKEMTEISDLSTSTLISHYIEMWSREAEAKWIGSDAESYCEFYDFIDKFSQEKLEEFKKDFAKPNEPKKKAKLVTFYVTTRVVVNENEMPECEEEDAINAAVAKIMDNPTDYIHAENIDDVYDDTDCPYNPETDNQ